MICDFFRKDVEGTSPIGGGHDLIEFYNYVATLDLDPVEDLDITEETAPSIDIVDDFLTNAAVPIYDLIFYALENNYPRFTAFIRWKFRKRFEKINYKYLQRKTNGESFAHYKSYHLLVYKKR